MKQEAKCEHDDDNFSDRIRPHEPVNESTSSSSLKPTHRCTICDKNYKTILGLHQHRYYKHNANKPMHNCPYCKYSNYMKNTIQQHLMTCEAAKEQGYISTSSMFSCDLCKYSARQKGNLDTHRFKMHNIPRPSTRISRNAIREQLKRNIYSAYKTDTKGITCWTIQYIDRETGVRQIDPSSLFTKIQSEQVLHDLNTLAGLSNGHQTKHPQFTKEWSSFNSAFKSLQIDRPRIKHLTTKMIQHVQLSP